MLQVAALPVQNTPTELKPTVEPFPLNTSGGSIGSELERVCVENELVITTWSPIHLRDKLKELYWKGDKIAVGAKTFWEDTLRYLYLPRLKTRDVLAQAIRSGAGSKDFFGTAYGDREGKFEGFKFGDSNVQLDDTLLLIAPEVAKRYDEQVKAARLGAPTPGALPSSGSTPAGGQTPNVIPPGSTPPLPGLARKAHSFHGTGRTECRRCQGPPDRVGGRDHLRLGLGSERHGESHRRN